MAGSSDREERQQRVEQNNRIKEAEQREREQQLRAEEERLREFRLEQERPRQKQPKSPAPAGLQQQHPPLQKAHSNASSSSSTTKSQPAVTRTPTSKQPLQGSSAVKSAFKLRPIFPPISAAKSTLKSAGVKPSANIDRPALATPPPPPRAEADGAMEVDNNLLVSAGGSTTPYPHRAADEIVTGGAATPEAITPRQVAVPPKRAPVLSLVAEINAAEARVVDQPKRKPALTAVERARQREIEKQEKEMKAMKEREEALHQLQILEDAKKEAEEKERRRREEQARLEKEAEEAHRLKEESEKKKIQEAIELAEKELTRKREAIIISAGKTEAKNHGSPFLPPGLPNSAPTTHASIAESFDGDSIDDSRETVTQAAEDRAERASKKELAEAYDGSISEDLTASFVEPTASPPSQPQTSKTVPAEHGNKTRQTAKNGKKPANVDDAER